MGKVERFVQNEEQINELQYNLIKDFVLKRKNANLTQEQLAAKTSIIRTTIARIESGVNSPQVDTLLKLLEPLGYTLKIVPIEKNKVQEK